MRLSWRCFGCAWRLREIVKEAAYRKEGKTVEAIVLGSWYLALTSAGWRLCQIPTTKSQWRVLIVAGSCGRKLFQRDFCRLDLYGLFQLGRFHVPDQTHGAQNADAVPV